MKRKVLLIINPMAGKKKSQPATFEIVEKFSHIGYDFTVKTTTCPGDATNIVKKFGEGFDLVVCCGGDGTLNETINGVMALPSRLPVGYIPTGSTNDLAATLGIPPNIRKATQIILSRSANMLDPGLFNTRYFCYVASFGVGTEISYTTSQTMKNILGHSAYLLNGFVIKLAHLLRNIKPVHLRVDYDDGIIEDDFFFGAISNASCVAGLFKYDEGDVRLDDGIFEMILVRLVSGAADAFEMLRKIQKREYDGDRLLYLKTRRAVITGEQAVPWTLDGEYGGEHDTVNFEVVPRAIKISSPQNPMFIGKERRE